MSWRAHTGAGQGCIGTVEGRASAVTDAAIGVKEMRAASPTQTTTLAASNAVATIFRCVVASALNIDEFMTVLPNHRN
jgi:hypothetical protein